MLSKNAADEAGYQSDDEACDGRRPRGGGGRPPPPAVDALAELLGGAAWARGALVALAPLTVWFCAARLYARLEVDAGGGGWRLARGRPENGLGGALRNAKGAALAVGLPLLLLGLTFCTAYAARGRATGVAALAAFAAALFGSAALLIVAKRKTMVAHQPAPPPAPPRTSAGPSPPSPAAKGARPGAAAPAAAPAGEARYDTHLTPDAPQQDFRFPAVPSASPPPFRAVAEPAGLAADAPSSPCFSDHNPPPGVSGGGRLAAAVFGCCAVVELLQVSALAFMAVGASPEDNPLGYVVFEHVPDAAGQALFCAAVGALCAWSWVAAGYAFTRKRRAAAPPTPLAREKPAAGNPAAALPNAAAQQLAPAAGPRSIRKSASETPLMPSVDNDVLQRVSEFCPRRGPAAGPRLGPGFLACFAAHEALFLPQAVLFARNFGCGAADGRWVIRGNSGVGCYEGEGVGWVAVALAAFAGHLAVSAFLSAVIHADLLVCEPRRQRAASTPRSESPRSPGHGENALRVASNISMSAIVLRGHSTLSIQPTEAPAAASPVFGGGIPALSPGYVAAQRACQALLVFVAQAFPGEPAAILAFYFAVTGSLLLLHRNHNTHFPYPLRGPWSDPFLNVLLLTSHISALWSGIAAFSSYLADWDNAYSKFAILLPGWVAGAGCVAWGVYSYRAGVVLPLSNQPSSNDANTSTPLAIEIEKASSFGARETEMDVVVHPAEDTRRDDEDGGVLLSTAASSVGGDGEPECRAAGGDANKSPRPRAVEGRGLSPSQPNPLGNLRMDYSPQALTKLSSSRSVTPNPGSARQPSPAAESVVSPAPSGLDPNSVRFSSQPSPFSPLPEFQPADVPPSLLLADRAAAPRLPPSPRLAAAPHKPPPPAAARAPAGLDADVLSESPPRSLRLRSSPERSSMSPMAQRMLPSCSSRRSSAVSPFAAKPENFYDCRARGDRPDDETNSQFSYPLHIADESVRDGLRHDFSIDDTEERVTAGSRRDGDSRLDSREGGEVWNATDDQEDESDYCVGGYHRVELGDVYNDKYKILHKLGWGQFSTVWLAEHVTSQATVALKISKSSVDFMQASLDEIAVFDELNRCVEESSGLPSGRYAAQVVQMLDHFQLEGPHGTHLVMVFNVCGPNLLKLVSNRGFRGLPANVVRAIAKRTLQGLSFLHDVLGIVHTDIKLENILLTALDPSVLRFSRVGPVTDDEVRHHRNILRGKYLCPAEGSLSSYLEKAFNVKISDLGSARHLNKRYPVGILQTREYRCPEVLLGCPTITAAADMWSMGCMIYELLTADFLFDPKKQSAVDRDVFHIALFMQLLGRLPVSMTTGDGHYVSRMFDSSGEFRYAAPQPCNLVDVLICNHGFSEQNAEELASFILPMLEYDPSKRITAAAALKHPWLSMRDDEEEIEDDDLTRDS
ncbi:Serine/threonine-protein kinase SRPK [Diplonema papillatum]|nr:Serine/threonine-protein kinase SRPK [Diplonema papillatum]